ncbi:DUF222 domain-containing protein, partial [Gordonia sp. TBRC 11910]
IARRVGRGSWSGKRLDALVDSAIFRHDPDAVRRRHHHARAARTVTTDPLSDGMAELRTTATVEDVATAFAAIDALITRVCCSNDPRRRGARRSDAVIARLHGVAFECDCGDPNTCTGDPDDTAAGVSQAQVVIALHVITEQATLTTTPDSPTDDGMGYVDGYGIITGEQVRDIADRPETKISYFPNPPTTQPEPPTDTDGVFDGEPELGLDLDFVEAASPTVTDSESYEAEPAAAADETEPAADTKPEPETSQAATPEPHAAPTTATEPQPEPEPAAPVDEPEPRDAATLQPEPETAEAEAASAPASEAPACYRKPKLPLPCLPSDPYRFSTAFD